ncbi:MAG TPA: hypothetical protein VHL98_14400 [Microvirga sp.]|jgi:hypothetical protein|nr:hypothetical protein [Microvirga sp.]
MNLWRHLFGHDPALRHHGHLAGTGEYATHVEAESEYQDALEAIVGGRSEAEAWHECTAFLVPETDDPADPHAVAVQVGGLKVGALNREEGERYRAFLAAAELDRVASCDAVIYGGWRRGGAEGYFNVRLDLLWPLELREAVPEE